MDFFSFHKVALDIEETNISSQSLFRFFRHKIFVNNTKWHWGDDFFNVKPINDCRSVTSRKKHNKNAALCNIFCIRNNRQVVAVQNISVRLKSDLLYDCSLPIISLFMPKSTTFTRSPSLALQESLASSQDFLSWNNLTHVPDRELLIHPLGHKNSRPSCLAGCLNI